MHLQLTLNVFTSFKVQRKRWLSNSIRKTKIYIDFYEGKVNVQVIIIIFYFITN